MIEHFNFSDEHFKTNKAELITKLAQCLLVAMRERMGDEVYKDPWWSQDYIMLEKAVFENE